MARLRTRTEQIAAELLHEMEAAAVGGVDLVRDFASLLPPTLIAETLGAPVTMRRQFLQGGARAAFSLDPGMRYGDLARSERDIGAPCSALRTATRASSTGRSASTCDGATRVTTWPSRAVPATASAQSWRGWRPLDGQPTRRRTRILRGYAAMPVRLRGVARVAATRDRLG